MSRTYAANGLNQYTSGGPATFSYDANGNLTGDGTSGYGYDVENRLVSRSNGLAIAYDPNGRLWQTSGGASGTTRYLYDGDNLVAEYDASGTMLKRYLFGPGVDEPVVEDSGSLLNCTSTRFLHPDAQGSIIATADCNGNPVAINTYDEYGIPGLSVTGVSNTGRFRYTGQIWLPDLGMYYYKARIYSPTLGRFLQTDPIGYKDQVNLYAYVANDPVNGRDPTGMFDCKGQSHCGDLKAAQSAAANQIKSVVKELKGLSATLKGGGKLSSSQRSLQGQLDKFIGKGSGSNQSTIGKLIDAGNGAVSALQSSAMMSYNPGTTAGGDYATAPNRVTGIGGKYYGSFVAASPGMKAEIMAHEGFHYGFGATDRHYESIAGPYGAQNAQSIARWGPQESMRNADNLALAFGFNRDED